MRNASKNANVFCCDDAKEEKDEVAWEKVDGEQVVIDMYKGEFDSHEQEEDNGWIVESWDEWRNQIELEEDIDEPEENDKGGCRTVE